MSSIAKIAVSAATYWVDRPYDYRIPQNLSETVLPGMRVLVPFGRGNRRSEGIVLALADKSEYNDPKPIEKILDEKALLSDAQLKLALWMRERFFCTVYDAVKAMLPAGLWYKEDGVRKIGDKTVKMAELSISAEEALILASQKLKRAPNQSELLKVLCNVGRVSVNELCYFTGASKQSLNALERIGVIEFSEQEVYRRPSYKTGERAPLPELNESQLKAFNGISKLTKSGKAEAALLFGVTGSGKTTIYIRLIAQQLEMGKASIMLVPEIALTPQMLHTFSSHFGDNIAVLHSSLSMGERYDEWKRVKNGEAKVVIGTRSAVFAPVSDLGIIIIDEEQEGTYKSENNPRYHARDVAKYLCAKSNAMLLLGSATPDVESRYNAEEGKYSFFVLPGRFNEMALPDVRIVDMKRELRRGNGSDISLVLRDELEKNLDSGEQSILFINRRGAGRHITCVECGYTYQCENCSVSLTYHSANKRLMCHYCGHSRPLETECPQCGGKLSSDGTGTQKIEEQLGELFPGVEILRMDTDTVTPAGSHELLLDRFRDEKIPIMVGTQMVTKGLNFENVTLVGVISADQSLYAGDYRSGERTFSLITQVVGRSGRGERPGRAVIQTFTPENQTILQAASQDYESFYASEIELRRMQYSPPFVELYAITASGMEEAAVLRCCTEIRSILKNELKDESDARILGPAPLSVVKVNNRFRYRVIVSSPAGKRLRKLISNVVIYCNTNKNFRGISVFADVNPSE